MRPKEYFQLAPNMRTAYIELCIYLISKSATYKPGRYKCFGRETISQTSREILYTFGRRSTVVRSLRSYGLYGSTAVLQYGSTVVRSMEEESKGSKVFGIRFFTSLPPARRQEGRRISRRVSSRLLAPEGSADHGSLSLL